MEIATTKISSAQFWLTKQFYNLSVNYQILLYTLISHFVLILLQVFGY